MRKLLILSVIFLAGLSLGAVSIDLGLSIGGRSLADTNLDKVFGSSTVICPELSVNLYKGLTLGLVYEMGNEKSGNVGTTTLYPATMKYSGFEGFIGYTLDLGRFHPFVRLGYNSTTFEMDITAPHLPSTLTGVEKTAGGVTFGGGVKVDLIGGLYLGGQIRYMALKMTPVEAEIDLGGLRYMATIGYRFDL